MTARQAATLAGLIGVVGVLAFVVARSERESEAPVRAAVLKTSLLLGALGVLAVETLSAFTMLAARPLVAFWAAVVIVALAATTTHGTPIAWHEWRRAVVAAYASSTRDRVLLSLVLGCSLVTFCSAVLTPPNNWDAMTYHMPRVAHWLADGAVRHYPTARTQQLFMPPLNAYLIAVLQAVAGSDAWANLVQWAAYVAGAAMVSLTIRRLHGGSTAELAGALAFITLPMAIAQASTTQADLLTAYWTLTLIALIVGPQERGTPLWTGLAIGLGMMTKPSFALYAAPLVAVFLVRRFRSHAPVGRFASTAAAAAMLGAVAVAPQLPHFLRNEQTFGTPLGGGQEVARMQNEHLGPRSWLSNLLRATAVHVPIPGYGAAVIRLHHWLGIDPDDPRTTHLSDLSFSAFADEWFRPLVPSENSAGNPAHFLTAVALLLAVSVRPRGWSPNVATAIAIGVLGIAGWALLSLPFKWQAWASRFDLPLFGLLCVPFGIAMSRTTKRASALVMASWVLGALPALGLASHRPLIGADFATRIPGVRAAVTAFGGERLRRALDTETPTAPSVLGATDEDLLFRSNPDVRPAYRAAVAAVRASECTTVGLELERDDWEYPFWRLLGAEAGGASIRIENVGVTNETASLPPEGPAPCIVVSAVGASAFRDQSEWVGSKLSDGRLFTIYRKRATVPADGR